MRMPEERPSLRRLIRSCVLLIMAVVLTGTAVTSDAAGQSGPAAAISPRSERTTGHDADLHRVLSVIEVRTKDEKVLVRMREKLATLGDRELHLAASLCARIADGGDSAGADIAFSIVTALIVLS